MDPRQTSGPLSTISRKLEKNADKSWNALLKYSEGKPWWFIRTLQQRGETIAFSLVLPQERESIANESFDQSVAADVPDASREEVWSMVALASAIIKVVSATGGRKTSRGTIEFQEIKTIAVLVLRYNEPTVPISAFHPSIPSKPVTVVEDVVEDVGNLYAKPFSVCNTLFVTWMSIDPAYQPFLPFFLSTVVLSASQTGFETVVSEYNSGSQKVDRLLNFHEGIYFPFEPPFRSSSVPVILYGNDRPAFGRIYGLTIYQDLEEFARTALRNSPELINVPRPHLRFCSPKKHSMEEYAVSYRYKNEKALKSRRK